MSERNMFSWTVTIVGSTENGFFLQRIPVLLQTLVAEIPTPHKPGLFPHWNLPFNLLLASDLPFPEAEKSRPELWIGVLGSDLTSGDNG